jgi:hypothetical protein
MPDESNASEDVAADNPDDQSITWAPMVLSESLEVDPAEESADTNGETPAVPSSDRAAELASDHWRERAIVWRERAMAAELVAKMLQRNLDDVRANLEDLRVKLEADAARSAAITSSEAPWRRFARDLYDKYLG